MSHLIYQTINTNAEIYADIESIEHETTIIIWWCWQCFDDDDIDVYATNTVDDTDDNKDDVTIEDKSWR